MKKTYVIPEITVSTLSSADVISVSGVVENFFDNATRDYVVYASDAWFTGE